MLSVFVLADQLQVFDAVVASVPVSVVNVEASRDGAVLGLPYVAVQERPLAIGSPEVAGVAQCVAMLIKHDERKRLGTRAQVEAAELEHLIDALPGDAERLSDTSQAVAILVQLIHRVRLVILAQIRARTEAWTHIRIVSMGVSGVNL